MASFWYTPAKTALANGDLDLVAHDIRCLLVMTNTTADTDQDLQNIADIGTLDEYDGAGYARAALASEAVNEDAANNRAEFTATSPISFGATVAAGTRQAAGMVVYRHVTNDADAVLIAYIDTGGFPVAGGGGAFEVAINAEGLLQVT